MSIKLDQTTVDSLRIVIHARRHKNSQRGLLALRPSASRSGSHRIIATVRRAFTAAHSWLACCYEICNRTGFDLPAFRNSAAGMEKTVRSTSSQHEVVLQRDDVLRLTHESGCDMVQVVEGTIWITSTPAEGDVLLRPGARFHLNESWPFVLQALSPAIIVLTPSTPAC